MKVEIFGSGCSNCTKVYEIAEEVVSKSGIIADIVKVTEMKDIVSRGIMRTPALAINGKVVCAGRIPKLHEVEGWIK